MPLVLRDEVCNLLNGDYGPTTKGFFNFAIEMGTVESQARCFKDAKQVFDKLITMRVSVFNIITGLVKIERPDAIQVLVEWMQNNSP